MITHVCGSEMLKVNVMLALKSMCGLSVGLCLHSVHEYTGIVKILSCGNVSTCDKSSMINSPI